MCYRYVFGPSNVMTPFRWNNTINLGDHLLQPGAITVGTKPPIHTSILATCKTIHTEALDVLYGDRTIRADITQFWALVSTATFRFHVRRVEIDDWINGYRHPVFIQTLLQMHALPGIRSIIILCDSLTLNHVTSDGFMSVPNVARSSGLGDVICVDVGRYQLMGRLSRIEIVHRRLVEMWPSVTSTPDDYDTVTEVLALIEASPLKLGMCNVPIWAAQTSLCRWVGLFDKVSRMFSGRSLLSDMKKEEQVLLVRFHTSTRAMLYRDHNGNMTGLHRTNLLKELKPGDDPAILSWATELLAMNIASYRSEYSPPHQQHVSIAHWAEVDGGAHTFDIAGRHVVSALNGGCNVQYVPHPVLKYVLRDTYFINLNLDDWYPPTLLPSLIPNLTPIELKRLYFLDSALKSNWNDRTDQQSADDWSSQLLRRYLSATGLLVPHEVQTATLEDMRWAMKCVLEMVWHCPAYVNLQRVFDLLERLDDPIGLHEELIPELAWKYNSVFVHTWRIVVREGFKEEGDMLVACDRLRGVYKRILRLEDSDDDDDDDDD